ncbi:ashwin isoform X2 [Betta splendens]|uniref:Ashwin n=1 Tax=Betta splendens TaxID=158456 RepID=A0A6P7LG49_BETSP|nr:ashwin isoform X2 [Betta splendens]
MAASTGQAGKSGSTSDVDVLLHPELLSQPFMELLLNEKNVSTRNCASRDRLTELYLRHVIPLPQRTLPDSRWGRRVRKTRREETPARHSNDHRKRPIVFDGSSSHSGPLKVKKPEGATVSATGVTDRLKPPPAANLSNPVRRLSSSTSSSSSSSSFHSSTDVANLKRQANNSGGPKSPEVKKKIQHVTWP